MTDKKEKILESALELFANEGYFATSTSKIARHASVSEGLIFRHFGNKEGLLSAILREGEERSKKLFAGIVFESDPREVIRKTLHLSLFIKNNPEEAGFWKLQYKIKWEVEEYSAEKMEPLHNSLRLAFEKLGRKDPDGEATTLLLLLDGLATRFFLQADFDLESSIRFLERKYL